jgi:hypothetical protein
MITKTFAPVLGLKVFVITGWGAGARGGRGRGGAGGLAGGV